ncbi:MAG: response regulator [Vicinamibacterales bacterium]
MRGFIRTLLHLNGYVVLEARNAGEALDPRQHPDGISLLLTDTVMPDMNGTALRRALQQDQPRMKVIYMSGYPDDVTLQCQVEDGGAIFLQKPFQPQELVTRLPRRAGRTQRQPTPRSVAPAVSHRLTTSRAHHAVCRPASRARSRVPHPRALRIRHDVSLLRVDDSLVAHANPPSACVDVEHHDLDVAADRKRASRIRFARHAGLAPGHQPRSTGCEEDEDAKLVVLDFAGQPRTRHHTRYLLRSRRPCGPLGHQRHANALLLEIRC